MKNYIWGSEIWSLSAHRDGDCKIAGKDLTLSQIFCDKKFPVMVKFIDSKLPLSVQVHPDDDYAAKVENDSGKNEMWQVIAHEPDAFLYLGFNGNYERADVESAINDGTLINLLQKIKVHIGDKFFIKAGTVHAIGGGILLAETQQNSNITYRVYDYNRVGNDGKPRELHVKKALDVMKLSPADYAVPEDAPFKSEIIKINKNGKIELNADGGFLSAILISGGAVISSGYETIYMCKYRAVCVNNDAVITADNNCDAEILTTRFKI